MKHLINEINWQIAAMFKHISREDNAFASLIVPATVAFVTAIATVAWLH